MKMQTRKTALATLALAIGCTMTGCQSFQEKLPKVNKDTLTFWKKKEITDGSNAKKMIALWSENVAYGAQLGAKRGMGGRLYFYDEDQKPTKIEGQLVVYAYDDEADPDGTEPARKYVFTEDEFSKFYSESEFGPSYSVWLPWDDVGNPKQAISLVPIFKTASGSLLRGELSRSLLPGKSARGLRGKTTTSELDRERESRSEIRRVSFTEEDETPTVSQKNFRRTSIRMPSTMRQRIIDDAKASGNQGPQFQPIQSNVRAATAVSKSNENDRTQSSVVVEDASTRIARLYKESKRRAGAIPSDSSNVETDETADLDATGRPQYLGLQRPIHLRSE